MVYVILWVLFETGNFGAVKIRPSAADGYYILIFFLVHTKFKIKS